MRRVTYVGVMILGLWGAISVALADDITGNWDISEDVSALTNMSTVVASLDSTTELLTRKGRPKKASFVIRCSDQTLAAFVTWPETLNHGRDNTTPVSFRVDNQPIVSGYWYVAKGSKAAGGFNNDLTMRLLNSINSENRLVVRLTGHMMQDAVFDIKGIGAVIAKVQAACGLDANAMPSAMPLGVPDSPGASTEVDHPVAKTLAAARDVLEAAGYKVVKHNKAAGMFSTAALDVNLSTKMANCGKSWGTSILSDKRASTAVAYFVSYSGGILTVKVAINGLYKAGHGTPNKALNCVSSGQLEKEMLQNIVAKL